MKKYEKLMDTFKVQDSSGNIYEISCFQDVIEETMLDGTTNIEYGLKTLRTNGSTVNFINESNFLIVNSGIKVSKVS